MKLYTCDYWLVDRTKCREAPEVESADEYGAPLRFCARHWRYFQKHIRSQFGKVVLITESEQRLLDGNR